MVLDVADPLDLPCGLFVDRWQIELILKGEREFHLRERVVAKVVDEPHATIRPAVRVGRTFKYDKSNQSAHLVLGAPT